MTFSNFPDELNYKLLDDKIRFEIEGISTNWLSQDDLFIKRLNLIKPNQKKHLIKEIEIKNTLDEGFKFLEKEKYSKAIQCFDKVIYYDSNYASAIFYKSQALKGQKHFVKSLRNYKKAIQVDASFNDRDYYKGLLKLANEERSNFPKIKLNIYAGDEYFADGEFDKALKCYDKALVNPSKFKDKILFKLINKKATSFLKLNRFSEAEKCFLKSFEVKENDYAIYGKGYCRYKQGLNVDDDFKKPLKISKKQALNQIIILNKLKFFKESLNICEEILDNHFIQDDLYFKLNQCRDYSRSKISASLSLVI